MTARIAIFLLLTTALGVVLRLLLLGTGINIDDAITLYVARAENLPQLLERVVDREFGPPLYFIFMHFFLAIFGESTTALAAPSILFGSLVIPTTYFLAREISENDNWTAAAATYFAAISPLAIFYSHEARCYALLTLVTAITYYLILLLKRRNRLLLKIALFLCATALFYTHYLGILFFALLAAGYSIKEIICEEKLGSSLKPALLPIALSLAAFMPWLPSMITHLSHGTYWVDPTPLLDWPKVFFSNLAATLPLPWLQGLLLLPLFFLGLLITALIPSKRKSLRIFSSEAWQKNPHLIPVLFTLLTAVSILGYITPFILGYSRYMTPFALLTSVLCAITVASIKKRKIALPVVALILLFLGIDCTWHAADLGAGDINGLRQLAKDIKQGEYEKSAFLLTPDFDAYTFIYYLEKESSLPLPEAYFTYPRKQERTPSSHRGYAEEWQNEKRQDELLEELSKLDKDRYDNLIVIVGGDLLDSAKMPVSTRVEQLLSRLKQRYGEAAAAGEYKGRGRSFKMYRFKLSTGLPAL
ncbi:hypothetical protein GC174_09670 [bacterium]|nr:hypothetical protein [bacterium]